MVEQVQNMFNVAERVPMEGVLLKLEGHRKPSMFSKFKWTPKMVKVTAKQPDGYLIEYFGTFDKPTASSSPRKSFDTSFTDIVLYPTERQFQVHAYYKKAKYVMTFRAETQKDYDKWSLYFRKQMDRRSVRVEVNIVEFRSSLTLMALVALTVAGLFYFPKTESLALLHQHHKKLSLMAALMISVVFANRFTSGAIADVVNVVPFGVVENAMMFLNIFILAIFTFFYNETFGAYFQNACAAQGSAAAAVASP